MSKAVLNYDDIGVQKTAFHKSYYPIDIDKLNIDKILISVVSSGKKRFRTRYWIQS